MHCNLNYNNILNQAHCANLQTFSTLFEEKSKTAISENAWTCAKISKKSIQIKQM